MSKTLTAGESCQCIEETRRETGVDEQQGRESVGPMCSLLAMANVLRLPKGMYLLMFGSQTSISPSRMTLRGKG